MAAPKKEVEELVIEILSTPNPRQTLQRIMTVADKKAQLDELYHKLRPFQNRLGPNLPIVYGRVSSQKPLPNKQTIESLTLFVTSITPYAPPKGIDLTESVDAILREIARHTKAQVNNLKIVPHLLQSNIYPTTTENWRHYLEHWNNGTPAPIDINAVAWTEPRLPLHLGENHWFTTYQLVILNTRTKSQQTILDFIDVNNPDLSNRNIQLSAALLKYVQPHFKGTIGTTFCFPCHARELSEGFQYLVISQRLMREITAHLQTKGHDVNEIETKVAFNQEKGLTILQTTSPQTSHRWIFTVPGNRVHMVISHWVNALNS